MIRILLVYIALVVVAITGWVLNIVAIVHATTQPVTGLFIARCIGVFVAPIGAVLGYLYR